MNVDLRCVADAGSPPSTFTIAGRSALRLSCFVALNKLLGFGEKVLIAQYFGTSGQADVIIAVQGLFITGWLLVQETLYPALVPTLQSIGAREQHGAKLQLVRTTGLVVALVSLLAVLGGAVGFDIVSSCMFPGFTQQKLALAAELFMFFALGAVPFYLTPIFRALANSEKKFFGAASSQVLGRGAMIASMVVLRSRMGLMSVGLGQIAYSVVYLVVLMGVVRFPLKCPDNHRCILGKYGPRLSVLSLPLLLGFIFSQVSHWVDVGLGSCLGEGTLASLEFARKLVDVPVLLLSYCIGVVLLPYLSDFFERHDHATFRLYAVRASVVCVLFYGVTFGVYLLSADGLVHIVYCRGEFGEDAAAKTAWLLRWFSPGLLVFPLEIIVMQVCFAARQHWAAVLAGIGCAVLNIGATVILVPLYGVVVIPLALVAQKAVKTTALLLFLRHKLIGTCGQQVRPWPQLSFLRLSHAVARDQWQSNP